MIDLQTLQSAATRIARAASSPSKVIVFGSYANGTATERSDLDLLVVERQLTDPAAEYMALRSALGRVAPGVGVDLLLHSEPDYQRRSSVPGSVLFRARTEGQVLHDGLG
jgi:uncharacterized protein